MDIEYNYADDEDQPKVAETKPKRSIGTKIAGAVHTAKRVAGKVGGYIKRGARAVHEEAGIVAREVSREFGDRRTYTKPRYRRQSRYQTSRQPRETNPFDVFMPNMMGSGRSSGGPVIFDQFGTMIPQRAPPIAARRPVRHRRARPRYRRYSRDDYDYEPPRRRRPARRAAPRRRYYRDDDYEPPRRRYRPVRRARPKYRRQRRTYRRRRYD